jgi:hypothetical protein
MLYRPIEFLPSALGKWCAYALILLAPGSFIVLAVMGLVKLYAQRNGSSWGSARRDLLGIFVGSPVSCDDLPPPRTAR